jgi:hypothetical protein
MVSIRIRAEGQSRRPPFGLSYPSPHWGEGRVRGGVVKWRFWPPTIRNDEEGTPSLVIPAVFGGYLSSVSPREIPAKSKQE